MKREQNFITCEFKTYNDCADKNCPFLRKSASSKGVWQGKNICGLSRDKKDINKACITVTLDVVSDKDKEFEELVKEFEKMKDKLPEIPDMPYNPTRPQIPYVPPHPLYGTALHCRNCGAFIGYDKQYMYYAGPIICPVCGMDNSNTITFGCR